MLDAEVALVDSGKRNPRDVTAMVFAREARFRHRPGVGVFLVTRDLDHMVIAKELLAPGPLAVRVAVTSYRPERSAWGYHAVFIIGAEPD